MKNGDKMKKNLAGHLNKKIAEQSSARDKQRRGANVPVRPPSRSGRQDPVPDYLDNPLSLTSNFPPPDPLVPPYSPPLPEGIPGGDIQIDIEPPREPLVLPPITRRSSCGSFSTAIDDLFNDPSPDSPVTPRQTEIEEEPDMNEFENPIDAANLNVIGAHTPPPGYATKEEPPLRRVFKEINRIWIAPALAGVPAFIENWWKTRRAGRQQASIQASRKGVGAALDRIKSGTLSLTAAQAYSARIAGGVVLFLIAALIIYAYLEKKRRSHDLVFDTSKHNLARNRVVTFVPKERYLLERARQAREDALHQEPKNTRLSPPSPFIIPYEYPPAYSNRQRR